MILLSVNICTNNTPTHGNLVNDFQKIASLVIVIKKRKPILLFQQIKLPLSTYNHLSLPYVLGRF